MIKQCSLVDYGAVLVPLSQGQMSVAEKKLMINKFLEVRLHLSTAAAICIPILQTIPIHQHAAKKTAARFHELGKYVEVFPMKVSNYLRQEAEGGGFWESFWTGVEEYAILYTRAVYLLMLSFAKVVYVNLEGKRIATANESTFRHLFRQVLQGLLVAIVNSFQKMLSRVANIRFSCGEYTTTHCISHSSIDPISGPFVRIDIQLSDCKSESWA